MEYIPVSLRCFRLTPSRAGILLPVAVTVILLCLYPLPVGAVPDSEEKAPPPEPALTYPRVTFTDIDLTLLPEDGLIREKAVVKVEGSGQSRFYFRIGSNLTVERSHSSSGSVEHTKSGSSLRVIVDPPLSGERTFTFQVTGRPRRGAVDLVTPEWAALGGSDLWYPTIPGMWAEARISVTAPKGWTVLASGEGTENTQAGTSLWFTGNPVRNIAVAASPDLEISTGRIAGRTLRVASPETGPSAADLTPVMGDPMAWLSGALAPYPFKGFNLALIPGLPFNARGSGMLATTLDIPVEDRANCATLLTGQWYGELIAGDGPWIDSFAAWQAVTYARDRSIPIPSSISQYRSGYFDLISEADVPLSAASEFTSPVVIIGKGSAAPDMIRLAVGDRRFFKAVRALFETPAGTPLSLEQVRAVFEENASRDLEQVFSQWFHKAGAPRLKVTLRTTPSATGGWRADLKLVQLRGTYSLPVEVVLHGPGEEHRETVKIEEKVTSVYYVLPFKPARVEIDPLGRIFQRPPVIVMQKDR